MLSKIAKIHDVQIITDVSIGDALNSLITEVYEKNISKVVILIDEYDKPLLDNLFKSEEQIEAIKEFLSDFYTQIKANEECLKFVFLTGISKFARVGIFSKLNNLTDVSFDAQYGEMCGYTEDEIKQYFPDYLQDTADAMNITTDELMDKIRNYYDGFCFDGIHRLYNPYSTLLFFAKKDFSNYWFTSGTPKMIADYMKDKHLTVEQFRNFPIEKDFAQNPADIDVAGPENFLYQSGYLTLREGTTNDYSLDYPNTEVLNSMSKLLAMNIVSLDKQNNYLNFEKELRNSLFFKDINGLKSVFNRFLALIPYDDFRGAAEQNISIEGVRLPVQEWLYRSCLFSFLQGCGLVAHAEVHQAKGRPDLVLAYKKDFFIIEIKVANKSEDVQAKLTEAETQIREKEYIKPYPNAICLAMVIDDTQRQIVKCEEVGN
jgi:hypothetical protein